MNTLQNASHSSTTLDTKGTLHMNASEIKARLNIINNLEKIISELKNQIIDNIPLDKTTKNLICNNNEIMNIDVIIAMLDRHGAVELGHTDIAIPEISIDKYLNASISIKTDGGKLVMYNSTPDMITMQASVDYITDNDSQIQLTMAEVKKGELAKTPDNKDIDVYTYQDVYSDDYTDKFTIEYNTIDKAFE